MNSVLIGAAALAVVGTGAARAAETLELGAVGAANSVVWPHYVAEAKGFYAEKGLAIDLFYSQSG